MIARSIAVAALVLAGCYDLPHPVCGFACAASATVCPDSYTCNSQDNRCHLNGYADVSCQSVPDLPNDAADGPLVLSVQPTSDFEPRNTTVSVQFTKKVQHVSSTSFFLTDDSTDQVFPSVPTNPNPFIWQLAPDTSFAAGAHYTVHLTSEITDASGNHLSPLSSTRSVSRRIHHRASTSD